MGEDIIMTPPFGVTALSSFKEITATKIVLFLEIMMLLGLDGFSWYLAFFCIIMIYFGSIRAQTWSLFR